MLSARRPLVIDGDTRRRVPASWIIICDGIIITYETAGSRPDD